MLIYVAERVLPLKPIPGALGGRNHSVPVFEQHQYIVLYQSRSHDARPLAELMVVSLECLIDPVAELPQWYGGEARPVQGQEVIEAQIDQYARIAPQGFGKRFAQVFYNGVAVRIGINLPV